MLLKKGNLYLYLIGTHKQMLFSPLRDVKGDNYKEFEILHLASFGERTVEPKSAFDTIRSHAGGKSAYGEITFREATHEDIIQLLRNLGKKKTADEWLQDVEDTLEMEGLNKKDFPGIEQIHSVSQELNII